jgi:hypothetical protein
MFWIDGEASQGPKRDPYARELTLKPDFPASWRILREAAERTTGHRVCRRMTCGHGCGSSLSAAKGDPQARQTPHIRTVGERDQTVDADNKRHGASSRGASAVSRVTRTAGSRTFRIGTPLRDLASTGWPRSRLAKSDDFESRASQDAEGLSLIGFSPKKEPLASRQIKPQPSAQRAAEKRSRRYQCTARPLHNPSDGPRRQRCTAQARSKIEALGQNSR